MIETRVEQPSGHPASAGFNGAFALERKRRKCTVGQYTSALACVIATAFCLSGPVLADGSGDPAAESSQDGEYSDKAGNPTFSIAKDGTVDWYTGIGYTRYTANCMQCHGPDGLGSSFAPSLGVPCRR